MRTSRLVVVLACLVLAACMQVVPGLPAVAPQPAALVPAPPPTPPAAAPRTELRPAPGDLSRVAFSPPLVITEGGTYSGSWESLDPGVPAVRIATTEPVVLDGVNVRGRGHLIEHGVEGVDLTVRNTRAAGLDPGRDGAQVGRFVTLRNARNVLIEHSEIVGTAGISLIGYGGDGSPGQTFRVLGNRARNVDGRVSDGSGLSADDARAGFAQFVQLNEVRHVPGIEIAWNDVVNEPGASRVEDVISVWLSSGTPGSPIRISDNFVDGAYPLSPEREDYSGGGIMLGDGNAADGVAYVEATGNHVLNTTNYGMAISAGHDVSFSGNRILSDGRLPDGTAVAAQNVGAYVWNLHGDGAFSGNEATGNLVGWERPLDGDRNDWWLPDASAAGGNQAFPGEVTAEVLDAEYALWQREVAAAGVTVGPTE